MDARGTEGGRGGHGEAARRPSDIAFPVVLAGLETSVLDACSTETEWPAQIAAGIYAGVEFVLSNPGVARVLTLDAAAEVECVPRYERMIGRLTGFMQVRAPQGSRLPPTTDEALMAGLVGLVGDHIRVGRLDRLAELRPELVLLALLPYLGFAEARLWANRMAASHGAGT
jgi:hypothetical protein